MNDKLDDFNSVISNNKVSRIRPKFEINQIKLEHFYWNSGDIDIGMPISTSVELLCYFNYEKNKLEWKKIISHTYISFKNVHEHTTDTHEEIIDASDLINKISKYDLRDLKNNYFTEEVPERFSHWELNYNNYFKIIGTYDQEVEEFKKISEILDFKKIIENETNIIQQRLAHIIIE